MTPSIIFLLLLIGDAYFPLLRTEVEVGSFLVTKTIKLGIIPNGKQQFLLREVGEGGAKCVSACIEIRSAARLLETARIM